MNYHLMIDNKFIDQFIESAEIVAPGKNVYLFSFESPAKFVKSQMGIFALPFSKDFNDIIEAITDNDRFYIHWYEKYINEVINLVPKKTPVYLFFWGGDFLGQTKRLSTYNFDGKSRKYLLWSEKKILRYFPRNPWGFLKNLYKYLQQQKEKARMQELEINDRIMFLERLDFFCHWNKLDLEQVIEAYGGRPVLRPFIYDVGLDKISKPNGERVSALSTIIIWLGNSDTLTNNHLDAIAGLKQFSRQDVKVVCPLNYEKGDYQHYINAQGMKYFGKKWHSIIDFMPLTAYMQLMDNADVIVMFHNRTQAAGNIFAFLKMGKKVYLKKQSTIYTLLIANGIKIFDSNTIKNLTFEEFSKPLSADEIDLNYSIISAMFSDKQRLSDLKEILN